MNMDVKRRENESLLQYRARLYRDKITLGLTNKEIYELYIKETGDTIAESSCRCSASIYNQALEDSLENIAKDNGDKAIKELELKRLEIEKERKKIQATKIELNRNLRLEGRQELLYESIKDAKDRLPLPQFDEIPIEYNDGGYILSWADIHYGAEFESENNKYSREECKRRFDKLVSRVKNMCIEKGINHLNIIGLGDDLQGILRISDTQLNDIPVVESVVEVSRLIAMVINEISSVTNVTYYHTMASNHTQTRNLGTKANELAKEDLEVIIGNYIKDLVSNNERVNVVLTKKDYQSICIEGQNILCLHGHQIKGVKTAIKDYSMLHRVFYDICLCGHLHGGQSISVGESNGNTEIHIVPSFVGSDPYSDSLKVGSKAMAKMYKIERGLGITENYTIILN